MSGLVARVRANVDGRCIATRIRKEGCSVSLDGVPSDRLIVDLDKPGSPLGQADARCDYLFVAKDGAGAGWVAPMELTRGRCVARKFVRQLRAGAAAAAQLVPRNVAAKFRPVAVYGGGLHMAERRALQRNDSQVSFHGMREPVRLMKCGMRLADRLR